MVSATSMSIPFDVVFKTVRRTNLDTAQEEAIDGLHLILSAMVCAVGEAAVEIGDRRTAERLMNLSSSTEDEMLKSYQEKRSYRETSIRVLQNVFEALEFEIIKAKADGYLEKITAKFNTNVEVIKVSVDSIDGGIGMTAKAPAKNWSLN